MIKIDVLFGEDICESLREGSLEQFCRDYNENHFCGFLEWESEFNTEEEKRAYIKGLEDMLSITNKEILNKLNKFNTEEERKAYKKGLEDMDGWGDFSIINEEVSDKLNELIEVE